MKIMQFCICSVVLTHACVSGVNCLCLYMYFYRWQLQFVKSKFKGQLPKPYSRTSLYPTRVFPSHMNDANLEEPTRYVSIT